LIGMVLNPALFPPMSEFGFLQALGVAPEAVFKAIVESLVSGRFTYDVPPLTPAQVQKVVATARFLASQPAGARAGILNSLGCPNAGEVAAIFDVYGPLLVTWTAIHDLRDFDWSASLVLGTSTISNIKEPICTFRFDVNTTEAGKPAIVSRNIELTLEEAQLLLNQLEAARTAQRELLQR
jgi:hypothetical protein